MNAIDFLIKEHNKVKKLLNDINNKSHRYETKKEMFNALCNELIIHEKMEQTVWYPRFRNDKTVSDRVHHLLTEEKSAENAIKHFNGSETEKNWDSKFLKFKADVEHHADEEEKKLFPLVKKILDEDELIEIGKKMYAFKKEHHVTTIKVNHIKNYTKFNTAIYDNTASAEKAYHHVINNGYTPKDINVIMSDDTRNRNYKSILVTENAGDKSMEGLALGGALGGVVAGTLGAIAAIGTNVVFPGLGLIVAGPLAAGLAGVGAGSITGGLIGTLIGLGIPEEQARKYEKGLKSGGIVLGIHEKPKHPINLRHY